MPPPLKPQISTQQEELLWERRILSLQSSSGLIQAVIFYLIKSCGVYQGKDLRQLKTQHVNFGEDSVGSFVIIDFSTVVVCGKVVRHYDDPNNPRSLYKLLKTYIRYLANEGAFLVRPISSIKDYICYSPWPLGVSIIEHMVQTLMEEAGQGSRYGNISASLLALDVLKSYGAGRHCLAAWVDCLGGASLCYRAKVLNGKIPDCTTINCRDLNAEAGLIMSHLLDPPYPSSGSATPGDVKVAVEENEVRNSELNTSSNGDVELSQARGDTRGASLSLNSKTTPNRDRLRVVKRGGVGLVQVRRLAGGAGLNLHKKQARLMRFKSRDSQKAYQGSQRVSSPAGIDLTSGSTTTPQAKVIKCELQSDGDMPDVEIDLAGDLQPEGENSAEEEYTGNGDREELSPPSVPKRRQQRDTAEEEETSCSGKIPKIEQHFRELEASLCGNLEAFEDGAEQREDVTVDSVGETGEDFQGIGSQRANSQSPHCANSRDRNKIKTSRPDGVMLMETGSLECESPKKREHLSLVAGLEKWLGRLKQRVNSGSDPDMNGLLLQATSQLKVIADKVIASREETRGDQSPKKCVSTETVTNTDRDSPDLHVKDQLSTQPVTAQLLNSFQLQEKNPAAQTAGKKIFSSSPSKGTTPLGNGQAQVSDSPMGEVKTGGGDEPSPGGDHSPSSVVSLASPEHSGALSIDLSPPVLSPHLPTDVENDRDSFLFSHLHPSKSKESQSSSLESQAKDDHREGFKSQPSKSSSVPDLVKFLESANAQVQSLLSAPPRGLTSAQVKNNSNSNSDLNSDFAKSLSPRSNLDKTNIASSLNQKSSAAKVIPVLSLPVSVSGVGKADSDTNSLSSQPPQSLQNQSGPSWPVLRSVLEEALPPRTVSTADKLNPVTSGKSDHSSDTTSSVSRSGISSILSHVPLRQTSDPQLAAQSGMYTFHSDHTAATAFQSLTVVSGDKRSQVFTFPDLPLDKGGATSHNSSRTQTIGGATGTPAVRNARSELCLGDYLPRGSCVPASSIKVLTQQGSNGLEVVLRFDFSKSETNASV